MKTLKQRLIGYGATAIAAAAILAVAPTTFAADEKLTVATDPSFVPFESLDIETKEYVGYDIDMIREIAKRAGFDYELRTMDFNGIIPALQTGNVDIAIAGITITEEREKKIDFSDPYYDSGLKLMVRADNDSIETTEDLKGKSVSTKIGSTSYDYLTNEIEGIGEVTPYPGTSQMYMALISGNVDAAFYDVPNVLYFIKTRGKDKVKAVGPVYEGQQYGIAFPQDSKWREPVNEALASMKEDGTFAEIYKKWFDEEPPEDLVK